MTNQPIKLHADHDQLRTFVDCLFRYADPDTFVSLRSFDQFDRSVPPVIRSVQINGDPHDLLENAANMAEYSATADRPSVFAPPIATFNKPNRARSEDLANGLTVSVELDEGDIHAARTRLESILGTPTLVIASGSEYANPQTGELIPKLHIHWRLSEPTRTQEEHSQLYQARNLAALLAGADPTGKPPVHPLRWPGSWNRKGKPALAHIIAANPDAEIHLNEALEAVQDAIEAAGLAQATQRAQGPSSTPEAADMPRMASAMTAIPNPDAHYDDWIRFGYACYRAAGHADGRTLWDEWSRKSAKFNADEQELTWGRISNAIRGSAAPETIGAGTIFFHASRAGWKAPLPRLLEPPRQTRQQNSPENVPDDVPSNGNALKLTYFNDIEPNLNSADFVEGLLIEGAMSVIYGESNSGKTFFATDLALHVALGMEWNGRAVERGGVIYCALEGSYGIFNRLQAAREFMGITVAAFAVISSPINLLDPNADTDPLIAAIHEAAAHMETPVKWVIVDTLARALAGGNENAPDDMGKLVINADRIRHATGAHLTLIHHSGKDTAKGARGHSSLRAATDTELEVVDNNGTRTATVTKQRELETSGQFTFTLQIYEVGNNRRGKPVTSCIVSYSETDPDKPTGHIPRLKGHIKTAFDVLTNLLAGQGQAGFDGTPSGVPSVPEDWWRDRFYSNAMPGASQDTKKHAFRRASDALIDCRMVAMSRGRVWQPRWSDIS